MSQMQAIRYISTYYAKREWGGLLMTLVFTVYIGGFLGLLIDELYRREKVSIFMLGILDLGYLTIFPSIAMVMNKSAFVMWCDDSHSKRLAHFRTLPIPLSAIVQTRILQSVGMGILFGSLFQVLQYVVAASLREEVSISQWAITTLLGVCYSIVLNAVYSYIELGSNGKRYGILYLLTLIGTTVLVCLLSWQGVHIAREVVELAKSEYAGIGSLLSVLAAVLASWWSYRATLRRIRVRSLSLN